MYTISHQPPTGLHEIFVAMVALLVGYFLIRLRFNYEWVLINTLFKTALKLIGIVLFIACLFIFLNHFISPKPKAPKTSTIHITAKKQDYGN